MFKRGLVAVVVGSLAGAGLVAACSGRHVPQETTQPEGGEAGASGPGPEGARAAGGTAGRDSAPLGGAGTGTEPELGGAGAGNETELGGAGAGNDSTQIEEAAVLLETAVTSALAGSTPVTDPLRIAGHSYELRDCIGPVEGEIRWTESYQFYDELDILSSRFCPKLTLHFLADGDGLAVVVETPTESFPFAERLSLERRGDTWLVKGLTTSNHLVNRFEEDWAEDYYRAALTVFGFASDSDLSRPERLIAASTNSVEGVLRKGGKVFNPLKEDAYGEELVKWGKAEGLALSPGTPARETAVDVGELGLEVGSLATPGFRPSSSVPGQSAVGFGDLPILKLNHPVSADSVFYFENARGERSTPALIPVGDYVHGVYPNDYLAEGWDLVGEGTTLQGEHFSLRKPLTLVELGVAAGDFESETPWYYPTHDYRCWPVPDAGIAESFETVPAIAGAHSFFASGCPRIRIERAPGASVLKFEALRVGDCYERASLTGRIIPLAPGQHSVAFGESIDCAQVDEIVTVVAELPALGDDLLVELPDGYWIDSLRTE